MTAYILVASQSQATTQLVKEAIDEKDYEVIPATSTPLALFLAQKNNPDIILSYGDLTDGTALDLLKEMKADPQLKSIPFVILCSNEELKHISKRAAELGADDIIAMPLAAESLFNEIEPHIHRRVSTKEAREPETPE